MDTHTNQNQGDGTADMSAVRFETAFTFPFRKFSRLFNILWGLIPIIGFFLVSGYQIRIIQGFIRGEFEHLPQFHLDDNLKTGFLMFIKFIPFILTNFIVTSVLIQFFEIVGVVAVLFLIFFVYPILSVNFIRHETIKSSFDFRVLKAVFTHLGDYVFSVLKQIVLSFIFLLFFLVLIGFVLKQISLIFIFLLFPLLLIGIPANAFTQGICMADFYRRRVVSGT